MSQLNRIEILRQVMCVYLRVDHNELLDVHKLYDEVVKANNYE